MADCRKCGTSLDAGSAACANCGTMVAPRADIPTGLGILLGIVGIFFALFVYAGLVSFIIVVDSSFKLNQLALEERALVGIPLVGSLAGIVFGVRAARRGSTGLAIALFIPSIAILVPAAICSVIGFGNAFH